MTTDTEKGSNDRPQGTILITDDNPINLRMLHYILVSDGYTVHSTEDGPRTLAFVQSQIPILVLLDVNMPGMDGFEVCRRLKSDERTRDIPVIFISALDDLSNKIKGFETGGVDYITKPFQVEEVLARVKTHLTIRNLQQELEKKNQELIEATHLREEVELVTQHDLKGPLSPILSFPKLIRKNEHLTEKQLKYLRIIEESGRRILDMINRSLDLFKMEKGIYEYDPTPVDVIPIIDSIMTHMQRSFEGKKISVKVTLDEKKAENGSRFMVQGEEFLCHSILSNLITNAVEASSRGQEIAISMRAQGETNLICIHNENSVPIHIRDKFFEKYISTNISKGSGLGTYSARLATETQRGSIHLQTSDETGTTITVQLLKSD